MSAPEKRARYALHTTRLALRSIVFVFIFVSWALYIHRAVKCQQILDQIRHERHPAGLASDQTACWNQKRNGNLRPFLIDFFQLLYSTAVFVTVAVNKVGLHPGIDCAVDAIFALAIIGSSGELFWVVGTHPFNAQSTVQNSYLLAATILATLGAGLLFILAVLDLVSVFQSRAGDGPPPPAKQQPVVYQQQPQFVQQPAMVGAQPQPFMTALPPPPPGMVYGLVPMPGAAAVAPTFEVPGSTPPASTAASTPAPPQPVRQAEAVAVQQPVEPQPPAQPVHQVNDLYEDVAELH